MSHRRKRGSDGERLSNFYKTNRQKPYEKHTDREGEDNLEKVLPNSQVPEEPVVSSAAISTTPPQKQPVESLPPSSPAVTVPRTTQGVDSVGCTNGNDDDDDSNCSVCREEVTEEQNGIMCEMCDTWSHISCLHMSEEIYAELDGSSNPWYCMRCLSIKANKIKWGDMEGEEIVNNKISSIYNEVTKWQKNLFMLPRGKVGCDFIKEMTKILNLFVNDDKKWGRLALKILHVFIPLMLQKPSPKSKAKENAKFLLKRLNWWFLGDLKSLLAENRVIQQRLQKKTKKMQESKQKAFCRLMLLGKVSKAMNFINNDDVTLGVHLINNEVKQILQEKHPVGRPVDQDYLLPDNGETPQPVIFEEIDGDSVYRAAKKIQGSGGPTLIDADGWRRLFKFIR